MGDFALLEKNDAFSPVLYREKGFPFWEIKLLVKGLLNTFRRTF